MENNMKKIFLFVLLFVSACSTNTGDDSILRKSSCKLPCWNNTIVGQTTADEFTQFLETSDDINKKSIQVDDQPWQIFDSSVFFSFEQGSLLNPKPRMQGNGRISNNVIGQLLICGELNTTMGNIVEQIGKPEYIISGNNLDGNRNVILINPTLGVAYWYTTDKSLGNSQYEISSETKVECLDLFEPSLYEEMMEAGLFSMGHYNAEETLRVMYPWEGYGNLNEKYPPRQP
jgi:hypothetical protein